VTAERAYVGGRSYVLRDDDGKHVRSFTFRDILALLAVREGKAQVRERRRYAYGYADVSLVPGCDFYGIGFGTLLDLQRDGIGWTPLVTRPAEPGPLALTPFGVECLAAVLALPGVTALSMAVTA
jgi:hypothetical protein